MTTGVRTARIAALAFTLGFGSLANAQTPPPAGNSGDGSHQASQADRDQARRLALEGVTASNHADWATALDRFQHAEQLFHAPIHLRYMAIAYERTNHILDAALVWRRLTRENLAADAPEPFRAAVAEASREYPRLRSRLGEITFTITNPPADAQVELDGHVLDAVAISSPTLVEAGPHHVTAHAAGQPQIDRALNVAVGGTEEVTLPFAPPHVVDTTPVAPPPPRTETVYHTNPLRYAGIIGAGVGGALLIGGIITGVTASGDYSTLQSSCPNYQCPTQSALNQTSTVNSLATDTNVLIISGAVLAVAGTIVAIMAGPTAQTITVAAGPRGMDLAVHF